MLLLDTNADLSLIVVPAVTLSTCPRRPWTTRVRSGLTIWDAPRSQARIPAQVTISLLFFVEDITLILFCSFPQLWSQQWGPRDWAGIHHRRWFCWHHHHLLWWVKGKVGYKFCSQQKEKKLSISVQSMHTTPCTKRSTLATPAATDQASGLMGGMTLMWTTATHRYVWELN